MSARLAALLLGLPFGFTIAWSGMADPEVIRRMMLLQDWYLYAVFATGMAVGLGGSLLLRRFRVRTLLGREPITWEASRPEQRHVVGSVVFGSGWAIAASCPGPIAAQLASGLWWSGFTIAGIAGGILLFLARRDAAERASAAEDVSRPVAAQR